jgi:hypothetical protein
MNSLLNRTITLAQMWEATLAPCPVPPTKQLLWWVSTYADETLERALALTGVRVEKGWNEERIGRYVSGLAKHLHNEETETK